MNRNVSETIVDRGSAPDWIIVLFGVLVAVISLVNPPFPTGLGIIAGLLVIGAAAWDMYRPSLLTVGCEGALGFFTFLLPWIGGFAGAGIAWAVWILGILIILGAVWSWASHPAN